MSEFRIEKDSLGEVKVPANAYYGAQTQRAVINFPISGLKQYPAFIWGMAIIKRSAAEVHLDLGLLVSDLVGYPTVRRVLADAGEIAHRASEPAT